jgi:hypothetical protein
MKKITSLSLITLTTLGTLSSFSSPAQAGFGDFLLGAGAGAGTTLLIQGNQRRAAENRYRPVSAEQEFFRGLTDGTNGARYDNPRNSLDYDRGFEEGLRRRQGGGN